MPSDNSSNYDKLPTSFITDVFGEKHFEDCITPMGTYECLVEFIKM